MKKIFLTFFAVLCVLTAGAQGSDWGKFGFGIRAGFNMGYMRLSTIDNGGQYNYQTDGKGGFHVGLIADLPIYKKYLYIQPGVYITQKGAKVTESWSDCTYDDWGDSYCDDHEKTLERYNPLYIEVPVLISGRIDLADLVQLQINVGPYFAWGIGGSCKLYDKGEKLKFFDSSDPDAFKRFDCGISMGVSFLLSKHYVVGYQYELGLTNLYKKGSGGQSSIGDKVYNSNNVITLGYNF